ncbi:hypothetical protein [Natranaerobius trueperi]|uniref:Uncharacterized protein n=1 Tax=Natranaerobius trueperi TaxID=759412 RepID=A0A226BWS3_9FIRM|nr:hypothetical protein [Natranaerobius trueperi]OWZ83361.1 hypothetical protein CDO51_09075 [Natranaerobius trueperi]
MRINSKLRLSVLVIFSILLIPIIVAFIMELNLTWKVETDNDWIGFYASYLGSMIGVFGVFATMRIDQKKREEEKKDELFFNNIDLYNKILSSLSVEKLTKLKERLSELKKESSWDMINTSTKRRLKQIEGSLDYSDETFGLSYAVSDYISSNLYNELKVTLYSQVDEFNEAVEYEDVLVEILNEVTRIVINDSDIEIVYDDYIEISVSKDKLLEKFEKNDYTKGYSNQMDNIYAKLLQIKESKEWSEYISRRVSIYNQINELKNYINNRIDKVLHY